MPSKLLCVILSEGVNISLSHGGQDHLFQYKRRRKSTDIH